jgi:hypothetical protein
MGKIKKLQTFGNFSFGHVVTEKSQLHYRIFLELEVKFNFL